jgi:hypothetical protein
MMIKEAQRRQLTLERRPPAGPYTAKTSDQSGTGKGRNSEQESSKKWMFLMRIGAVANTTEKVPEAHEIQAR